MKHDIEVCPKCGYMIAEDAKFCVSCGYDFRDGTSFERSFDTLKSRLSFTKDVTVKQATKAKDKALGMVTPEKASETAQNMIDIVAYVAQDLKQGMSSDMVKAVDVNARVNFVAFSVGISIDLEKLPLPDKNRKEIT